MNQCRAVLFDVDGTLYAQMPLRVAMGVHLATVPWLTQGPTRASRLIRTIRIFRSVREELRPVVPVEGSLGELQYRQTATATGLAAPEVQRSVEEWMHRRPLRWLPAARRRGLAAALDLMTRSGLKIGAFSDYPTSDKLDALGIRQYFSLELCATDDEVNAFKPHPRGFLRACDRWQLTPRQVVYVGDREDTDAAGATAAGMECLIIGRDFQRFDQLPAILGLSSRTS